MIKMKGLIVSIKKAKLCFNDHKKNARKRGIDFHFTFEEWVKWWEDNLGPDWLKLRGRSSKQYQMARKGDEGPYCVHNVECLTRAENSAQVDTYKNKRKYWWSQIN